jgi:hypothetical protein
MDISNYYLQHSSYTDPGRFSYLFADLPRDLGDLCRVVDGIYINYMSETTIQHPIPQDRLPEINLLYTTYDPDFASNHEIVEVWSSQERRWRLGDPDLNDRAVQDNHALFDPLDVPRDRSKVGGLAWQSYRNGAIDRSRYGVSASSGLVGAAFIRGCLLQDLAALNKQELLC